MVHDARAPLCSGLARRPLKAVARVRIPSGLLLQTAFHQGKRPGPRPLIPRRRSPGEQQGSGSSFSPLRISSGSDSVGRPPAGVLQPSAARVQRDQAPGLMSERPSLCRCLRARDTDRCSPTRSLASASSEPRTRRAARDRTTAHHQRPRELLGVPVDTLYGWRHRGEGPRGYRIGRHVRYRRASVEAWLAERVGPAGVTADGAHRAAHLTGDVTPVVAVRGVPATSALPGRERNPTQRNEGQARRRRTAEGRNRGRARPRDVARSAAGRRAPA